MIASMVLTRRRCARYRFCYHPTTRSGHCKLYGGQQKPYRKWSSLVRRRLRAIAQMSPVDGAGMTARSPVTPWLSSRVIPSICHGVNMVSIGHSGLSSSGYSVVDWSGRMSVHERTAIEYQRREQVTYLERRFRAILVDTGGGPTAWGKG